MPRTILHSDLNSFYASVETMLNPTLMGKPVAVCGSVEDRHGIVLTKSQLAKQAGVKTGMAIWQAKQQCPQIIVVEPHYDQYLKYSNAVHEIYNRYTDQIEPFGIDECWLDVTGSTTLFGNGASIANELRETVKSELGLTLSIGVSYNKIFAKLGSDMRKPDATTVIPEERFKEMIWPLPASDLLFVGRATAKRLNTYGIVNIGGIAKTALEYLKAWFGINGLKLWQFANGFDNSRVCPYGYEPPAKSVGHGLTFNADLVNNDEVRSAMFELAQGVGAKLRQTGIAARAVSIYVRNNQLYWQQHQAQLPLSTQSWHEIAGAAFKLFCSRYSWQYPIRTLSVTATKLAVAGTPQQTDLFFDYEAYEKQERLEKTLIDIRNRYGLRSIELASTMINKKIPGGWVDEKFVMPSGMYQ